MAKTDTIEQLVTECEREAENCLYTSASLYCYLRVLRYVRIAFIVVPLVCGSLASWWLLKASSLDSVQNLTAILSFVAGLTPAIFYALKFDEHLSDSKRLAAEFKNLRDRFRQAGTIYATKTLEEFEAEFERLMDRLELARTPSATPPEFFFRWAQKKIKSGDYDFDADENRKLQS